MAGNCCHAADSGPLRAVAAAGAHEREPYGLQRGTTVTLTLNGANMMGADQVLFDAAGLAATIGEYKDRAPTSGRGARRNRRGHPGQGEKNRGQIAVTAAADVPTGRHGFRLHTPLGTTAFISFWVAPSAEAVERTPNDAADKAMALTPPVTVNGSLPKEGDVDYYRVDARAGRGSRRAHPRGACSGR